MDWRQLRVGLIGGLAAAALLTVGVVLIEQHQAEHSLERQVDAVRDDLVLITNRLTRDLIQEVAVVQGLVALVGAQPDFDQAAFAAYTHNFRRGHENLRRVYLVRDGKVTHTDRPAGSAVSFARVESRLAASEPMAAAAMRTGSAVMNGPFSTTEGDDVFVYARPIFGGDGKPDPAQFWGFAGINIDEHAITCPLGLCDERKKYRTAVRVVVEGVAQPPFVGDVALFEPAARAVQAASRIPGVRIEMAAVPIGGWIEGAPRRWMIRGIGGAIALFVGGLVLVLFTSHSGEAMRTRVWAAAGSTGVLLLVLGVAAVLDRFEAERVSHQSRDATINDLQLAAARATRDLSDDVAVIQNLTTFVQADPQFSEASFQRYGTRIRQLHPNIVSVQLARGATASHISPPDPGRIGVELRRSPAEAAAIDQSIATGEPILAGPMRVGAGGETFLYRRPIYLGDGTPSRDRFWGFASIRISRDAAVCALGACEQPPKYRHALRLVVGETPHAPFVGDAAMFAPDSNAAHAAVRVPGGRIEMAAVPVAGWLGAVGTRWLIWAVAIPLALAASGRLLLVFFGLPAPVLRIWIGFLVVLGGGVLWLLREDVAEALHAVGIKRDALVLPAIATLIALAVAYTINTALSVFVWPEQRADRVDSLQRAPAILRHFIGLLLYATAGLWAAAFAFDLDLRGVGLTSGAVGIIVGFATQRLILDFFSGVMLGVERPYAIGDWVEVTALGREVRGVIYEMTWRTTLIRNVNMDIVTIPNSILAQATVVNRSRPTRWTQINITFEVSAAVPFQRVEETMQAGLAPLVGDVLVAEHTPGLRAIGIREGDIEYVALVYGILGPRSEWPIRTKVVAALQGAFARAGIEFSSTSGTVLRILAGATGSLRKPN